MSKFFTKILIKIFINPLNEKKIKKELNKNYFLLKNINFAVK